MGVPVAVRANLRLALTHGRFDVVHGFEPGLPSLSYLALTSTHALTSATFFSVDRLGYPARRSRRDRLRARVDAVMVGAETVRGPEGGDPASVAFDAVARGVAARVDTVLLDTAGRLHTKSGLMDELGKVKRVVEKHGPVDETLLVLDATTGQNGVVQARAFTAMVDVTGIVLTKLDGSAKGGIVLAVQRELGIPVKLIGLGEGPDDLAPFEPEAFADALLGDELAL